MKALKWEEGHQPTPLEFARLIKSCMTTGLCRRGIRKTVDSTTGNVISLGKDYKQWEKNLVDAANHVLPPEEQF